MQTSHLRSLKAKHRKLERHIHEEQTHAARNDMLIERLKKEKLQLKELIERLQGREHEEAPSRRVRTRT